MRRLFVFATALTLLGAGQGAFAQEAEGFGGVRVYAGLGQGAEASATRDGSAPWVVGALLNLSDQTFLGFDIAGEGTTLDSTYDADEEPKQSTSFNAVIGRTLTPSAGATSPSIDAALLVGFRETAADCPASNLGFQCYADREPEYDHALNAGAMVMVNFNGATLGLRATRESQQVIFGLQF